MTPARAAILAFLVGTGSGAAGMSGAALLREAPGEKTYYTHKFELTQVPLPDGGNDVTSIAYITASLALADGGVDIVDLGPNECVLNTAQTNAMKNALTASANCGRNAR